MGLLSLADEPLAEGQKGFTMTVSNTCQACESATYTVGTAPTCCSADGPDTRMEVAAFLTIGDWNRSYTICENCAKRLIAEVESFFNNSRAFSQLSLGELQARMDSAKRDK